MIFLLPSMLAEGKRGATEPWNMVRQDKGMVPNARNHYCVCVSVVPKLLVLVPTRAHAAQVRLFGGFTNELNIHVKYHGSIS